jgi:hypothetical protein
MLRSALLVCVGILAAACFGCAPTAPSPFNPMAVCSVVANVQMVSPAFSPLSASGVPPTTGAVDSHIQADILKAYAAAPAYFKNQLCNLNGLYVTPAADSWGYRDVGASPYARYIALSASLWAGNPPSAIPLYQHAQNSMLELLPDLQNDPLAPTYAAAQYNAALPPTWGGDGPITILAALAHEYGHILWFDTMVPTAQTPPDPPDFTKFCPAVFPTASWQNPPPPRRWQYFGERDDDSLNIPDDPNDPPALTDPPLQELKIWKLETVLGLAAAGVTKEYTHANKIIARLLAKSRPWPSLFGAFSVNEQFVETFVLDTLLQATPGLTSLALSIPQGHPAQQDIPGTLSKRNRLQNMLNCFAARFGSYPIR